MSQSSDPVDQPVSRLRKWLVPLLVASLSLNLLVAGMVIGGAWMRHHRQPGFAGRMAGGPAGPISRFIRQLPAERRATLQSFLDRHRQAIETAWPSVTSARRDLAAVLTATPFDRTKLDAALKKLNDADYALRTGAAANTGEMVEKLTDGERKELERLLRRLAPGLDDGRGGPPPPLP
jgi:uncharacterized membrane protein